MLFNIEKCLKAKRNYQFINQWVTESVDDFAMHGMKKRIAEKYKNVSISMQVAQRGIVNNASEKVVKHKNACSAR